MTQRIAPLAALAFVVSTLAAAPAFAEGKHAHQADEILARLDTDRDGRLSRAEVDQGAPRLAPHFDRVDTDRDGYVTRGELARALARRERRQGR